jgi:hypothetical protein
MNKLFIKNLSFNTISTLSLGIISLLSIPLVLNNLLLSEWVSVATYQAIGAVASVLVSLGWNLRGSERISRTHRSLVHLEYLRSIILQGSMLFVISITVYLVVLVALKESVSLYFLSFLSTAAIGLRSNWLYLGLAASNELFKREALPRVICNSIGCTLLILTDSVQIFFVFQIIGLFLSMVLTYAWSRSYSRVKRTGQLINKKVAQENFSFAVPPLLYTFGSYLPLFVIQHESTVSAAILAFLLRLRLQFMTFISPILDSFISKELSTEKNFTKGLRLTHFSKLLPLLSVTMISFPLFAMFTGVFIEDSNLNVSFGLIIIFTLYVSFGVGLFFVNSTSVSHGYSKRDAIIPLMGLLSNSLGVFFGYRISHLIGAISMMILSQVIMIFLILKFKAK